MRTDTGKATGDSFATLYRERNNETTHFVVNNNKTRSVRVENNIEALSCNHCCSGDAINITYSACVSVALVIRHAPYCHLWPARLYDIFPHYLIKGTIFGKKMNI
jgi:hypothetical protein